MITEQEYQTAEANGISRVYVRNRVYNQGWAVERAITVPIKPYLGLWQKYKKQCALIGLSREGFQKRLRSGMTPEQASTQPKQKWVLL